MTSDVSTQPPQYIPTTTTNTTATTTTNNSNSEPSSVDDVLHILSLSRKCPIRSMSVSRTRSESKTDNRIKRNDSVKSSLFAGDLAASRCSNNSSGDGGGIGGGSSNSVGGGGDNMVVEMTTSSPLSLTQTSIDEPTPYITMELPTCSHRKSVCRDRTMSEDKRKRALSLSGAVYDRKSNRRRENTLGLEFMSEEVR